MSETARKKRVVVSYKNLSPELIDEVKRVYPHGFTDHLIRIEKGAGDFFCAIMLETEHISYLIKVDVKVDKLGSEEEEEKEEYLTEEYEEPKDPSQEQE